MKNNKQVFVAFFSQSSPLFLSPLLSGKASARALRLLPLVLMLGLTACAGRSSRSGLIPDDARKSRFDSRAHYKVGNPYQIKGIWYYPKEDYSYDETGIASWYGDDFHAQKTANGEVYNKNELTAAHKTLPLPSLARVTNLENGRSVVVRVNDRGPFSGARIIDVSQRSAQLLGFEGQGTARVRVQVLADESKAIADAMRRYGGPSQEAAQSQTQLAQNGSAYQSPMPASVSSENLPPVVIEGEASTQAAPVHLPATRAEARAMMASVKPVAEARQLSAVTGTRLFVQIGAFSQHENAAKLRDKLSASVGPTVVTEAVINGAKYYRVRIGPVPDVASADKTLQKARKAGYDSARTIVETPEG